MIKEFQALGLDISVINNDDEEVEFKELEALDDDEDDSPIVEEINENKKSRLSKVEESTDDLDDDLEDEFEDDEEIDDDAFDEDFDEDYDDTLEEVEEDMGGDF